MGIETALITGGIGLMQGAMGARSARRNARSADAAMAQQQALQERQLGIGEEQMAFFREQYQNWHQQFAPAIEQLQQQAMEGREPDYAAITADNAMAFDSAQQSNQRQMERFGINPGDGQFGANVQRAGLGRAASEVDARQNARRQNEQQQFGQLAQVAGLGAGLQGQAMAGLSGAAGGLMGAMGQQAGTAGQNAQMYGDLAGQGAQAFGSTDWGGIIGSAFDAIGGIGGGTGGQGPGSAVGSYGVINNPSGSFTGPGTPGFGDPSGNNSQLPPIYTPPGG